MDTEGIPCPVCGCPMEGLLGLLSKYEDEGKDLTGAAVRTLFCRHEFVIVADGVRAALPTDVIINDPDGSSWVESERRKA